MVSLPANHVNYSSARPAPISVSAGTHQGAGGETILLIMAEDISALVDEFVQKVNARRHELLPPEDVPKFLLRPYPGDEHLHLDESDWSDWQILAADHAARIRELETRIGRPFPNPFRDLITRYSFPAFDCGP